MSSNPEDRQAKLRDKLTQQIAYFRARLEYEGEWPESADALLRQLKGKIPNQELTDADLEMLSLVVHDTLDNVDIQKRYPAFYKRLTEEPVLRDAVLEILEMTQGEAGEKTETTRPDKT